MKINLQRVALISVLLISTIGVKSQVTIGSNTKPMEGALLELKEEDNDTGGADSERGILLPRVELKVLRPDVGKLSESIGNTGLWDEDMHTGLLVYNVASKIDACSTAIYEGLYVWKGSFWEPMNKKVSNKPGTDIPLTTTDEYKGANSYLVATNSSITIPVERAFKIWEMFSGGTPADGKVLSITTDHPNLAAALSTNVIWADTGAISSATVNGTGSTANLVVTTGTSEGNVLVQLLLGGKVFWQWHIWVNNSDALKDAELYSANGEDNWYMSRLLGANSPSSQGLYYQWGRSVPMQKEGDVNLMDATVAEIDNLTNAIQSEKFIIYADLVSQDWYSSTANQWNDRWGTTIKSPFDPCPYGWRVPNTDSWECIDNAGNTQSNNFTSTLAGYRSNGDGSLGDVGVAGYVWTADANGKMAKTLYYKGSVKNNADAFNRANAMSVRCIKEKE